MRKRLSIILIIGIAFATLVSCGSKTDTTSEEVDEKEIALQESDEGVIITKKEDKGRNVYVPDTETFAITDYDAYAEVLKSNKEEILKSLQKVLLYDLNGDDSPELMFFTGYDDELHIYTMKDGRAEECRYNVDTSYYCIYDMHAAFNYMPDFAGSFMMYSGKEKGTFYIAYYQCYKRIIFESIKYTIDGDGLVKTETCVTNTYDKYPDTIDIYEIDGKSVSESEGIKEFISHREDYNELLMCAIARDNDFSDNFLVFKNAEKDKPLDSSYDEVMKRLGS
jgi:hypothetical protein